MLVDASITLDGILGVILPYGTTLALVCVESDLVVRLIGHYRFTRALLLSFASLLRARP